MASQRIAFHFTEEWQIVTGSIQQRTEQAISYHLGAISLHAAFEVNR